MTHITPIIAFCIMSLIAVVATFAAIRRDEVIDELRATIANLNGQLNGQRVVIAELTHQKSEADRMVCHKDERISKLMRENTRMARQEQELTGESTDYDEIDASELIESVERMLEETA
jgi:uncharacterized protein YoxC